MGLPVTDPVSQMLMFSSIFLPFTFHVPSHSFKSRIVVNSGSLVPHLLFFYVYFFLISSSMCSL